MPVNTTTGTCTACQASFESFYSVVSSLIPVDFHFWCWIISPNFEHWASRSSFSSKIAIGSPSYVENHTNDCQQVVSYHEQRRGLGIVPVHTKLVPIPVVLVHPQIMTIENDDNNRRSISSRQGNPIRRTRGSSFTTSNSSELGRSANLLRHTPWWSQ